MNNDTRETFGSSWGTVLVTAGAAIGLGNIWRFPYMMGKFGGASFLLIYLLVIVLFGIPAMMSEWALGRHTRRGPLGAFERAGMPGGRWWGYLLLFTVTVAGSYYAVIIGWVLYYAYLFAMPGSPGVPTEIFNDLTGTLGTQSFYLVLTTGLGCLSLYFGVKNGIERVSKTVLPLFFVLFAVLMQRSLTLPGAMEGVRYYLLPRWDLISSQTFLAATGQAFFSLALGGTFMLIYGSYMRREENIPRNAVWTAVADAVAALMAGFVIIPAVFAFDVPMDSGPSLMFIVMPEVFERLPLGHLFGTLFFGSVFLIAMLSLVAAYEVLVSALQDGLNWSRGKALTVIFFVELILAVPAMLSLDYLFYSDLIWGSTMQPIGSVVSIVALVWFIGQRKALDEISGHSGKPVPKFLYYWIKYVIPPAIVAALVSGWVG